MSDPANATDNPTASEPKPSTEPVPSGGADAGGAEDSGNESNSWLADVIPLIKKIELDEDGRIPTGPFLDTAKRFPELFAMILGEGRVSSHMKADVDGNVEYLRNLYDADNEKFSRLYDFRTESEGSIKLLWLQRGLMWLFRMIQELVAQPKATVSKVGWETYEKTLGKHHNWFVRKFVGVAFGVAPNRESLLVSGLLQSPAFDN